MNQPLAALLVLSSLVAAPLRAQAPSPAATPAPAALAPATPEQAAQARVHDELRALRDELATAVNRNDLPGILRCLHPDVVVTWQNAEVSRGRDGVKAYYERMLTGPSRVVESFAVQPVVDELTILHGDDTGIAFGRSQDHFVLKGGLDFTLDGRWSATLVRHEGRWVVASFHASTNLFDNVLLRLEQRLKWWVGAIGLLLGLVLGVLWGRRRRESRSRPVG